MDIRLLQYSISVNGDGQCVIEKHRMEGEVQTLFDATTIDNSSNRTYEGMKLEIGYRILKDYKNVEAAEKFLGKFDEKFFPDSFESFELKITPGEIEEWLDKDLEASLKYITGQKNPLE